MKASVVLVLSILMFLSGVSVFASVGTPAAVALGPAVIRQWIGKPATLLIKTFGEPSYSSAAKDGRQVYDYVVEPQYVSPVPTYQFVIGRDGDVVSATRSY